MVNNQNRYLDLLPGLTDSPAANDADKSDRLIAKNPLWCLSEIQSLVKQHADTKQTIVPVTKDARRDYKNLLENGHDLQGLFATLTQHHFREALWCLSSPQGHLPGRWLPCDAYSLSATFTHPETKWTSTVNYYFKFCKGLNGDLVLFVSIH